MTRWLRMAALRPILRWSVNAPALTLAGPPLPGPIEETLFGALALQLAKRVFEENLARCMECGQVFSPKRRHARYCQRVACRRAQQRNNQRA